MAAPRKDEEAATYVEGQKRPSPSTVSSSDGNGSSKNGPVRRASVAALMRNPLSGMTEEDVIRDVDAFVEARGLTNERDAFRKGALLARVSQRPTGFESVSQLSEEEKGWLRHEIDHRWSQPFMLYFLVILCAGSAIVQGMDQTSVNGAQQFYFRTFNIPEEAVWQRGLLNGAPYLCSALLGCWTNAPLNKLTGRRGTIFISCFISFASGIWMAAADSWYNLLIARFALGFAVGAKSSTTPVYAAESAPKNIRGALTMMWQMWVCIKHTTTKLVRYFKLTLRVDCLRNHAWICRLRRFSRHRLPRRRHSMEMDVRINFHPTFDCHGSSLLLSRVAPVVYGKGQMGQVVPCNETSSQPRYSSNARHVLRLQAARGRG